MRSRFAKIQLALGCAVYICLVCSVAVAVADTNTVGSYPASLHLPVQTGLNRPASLETAADYGTAVVFPLVAPRISSKFGFRKHPLLHLVRHHDGVDLAAPINRHVRSVLPGVVVFAGLYEGYGKLVSVRHRNGYLSMYGHLNEILVNPGQSVASGEILGRVGSTGISTGPHLHFEWRRNGVTLDPARILPYLASAAAG